MQAAILSPVECDGADRPVGVAELVLRCSSDAEPARLMHVGEVVTATRVLTQADFDRFAELSGDDNPIHVDPTFAATTRFGGTVSHGMLLYGLISGALSRQFPGAVQLEQELMFPNPAFAGDEVTVELRITGITRHAREAKLETFVSTAAGVTVCEGWTRVRPEP